MTTYILRRLLLMLPTLFGITLVVFTVMAASPGGISAQSLIEGQNLDPEAKREIEAYYNRIYGLDQPAPMQYLRWLNNISPIGFTFDENSQLEGFSLTKGTNLGQSFRYGRSVKELLKERIPITLLLNLISIPLIYVVAISIGVRAATQRGKTFDIASGTVMLTLWSIPTMLTGVLLIGFFANVQYWRWFPTGGLSDRKVTDMAFLPHWESLSGIFTLFGAIVVSCTIMIAMSRSKNINLRLYFMASIGLTLGYLMANSLPDAKQSLVLSVLISLIGGTILPLFGIISHQGFRSVAMGGIGIAVGVGLTNHWIDTGFTRGFLLDRLWHLTLPIVCLSYGGFAALSKLTRTAVLENLLSDYARTARAKGVKEVQVLWLHVFRNSLLPLITVAASLLPSLLAGSVIVESIFSIEGMGKLAIEAVQTRDRELVLSITLLSGMLTLIGYLVADLIYAVADPRISYE